MKTVALIIAFISEAWGLIFKVALVIIAIVVVVGFIQSCSANATLSEHSSCSQFEQADTTTQNTVLQNMITAHNGQGGLELTRMSVGLYCNTHDSSSPIDGVYNSNDIEHQSVQAFDKAVPHRISSSFIESSTRSIRFPLSVRA